MNKKNKQKRENMNINQEYNKQEILKYKKIGIKIFLSITTLIAINLLAGCSTEATRESIQNSSLTLKKANQDLNDGMKPASVNNSSYFSVENSFYVSKEPLPPSIHSDSVTLPDFFYKPIDMNIQHPELLTSVITKLNLLTSLNFYIDQGVLHGNSGTLGTIIGAGAGGGGAAASTSNQPELMVTSLVYKNGDLKGLLDHLTYKLNLSWRWTNNQVVIYRYETKVFRIDALSGKTEMQANLDTASSTIATGGGGTQGSSNSKGNSGQTTSVNSSTDIWSEITNTIHAMLSPEGKMTVSPVAATITVKDTPEVLSEIGKEVKELNRIYSNQVLLDVEVYSVDVNNADNYGIDWNALFANAAKKYGFGYSTSGNTSSSSGPNGNIFTITKNSGPWNGSNVIFSALSTLGKTTILTNAPVITLNNQTVPLNVSNEVAYLQSYQNTTVAGTTGGTASATLTPGLVTEGFAMNFTPLITNGNNLIIRYTADLSTIKSIQTFTAPNNSAAIQLPQRTVKDFMANVRVKSGQTLVLAGFQQNQSSNDDAGLGGFKNWVLGGHKNNSSGNKTIVVVVTPYILGSDSGN